MAGYQGVGSGGGGASAPAEWETVFTGYTGQVDMSHIGNGKIRLYAAGGGFQNITKIQRKPI